MYFIKSRLTVVSHEAKAIVKNKMRDKRGDELLTRANVSSFDIIITARTAPTFKPALQIQNVLANINQHPKDKSNRLSSLSFPAWSKSMKFVFTFFDGSSQFSFLNRHISLRLALLLDLFRGGPTRISATKS